MDPYIQMLVTIVVAMLGSSGLWAVLSKVMDKRSAQSRMLVGLGHDRIEHLSKHYIDRGFITMDEYENLYRYLYQPYKALGGNGSAERFMNEVSKLPIHSAEYYFSSNDKGENNGMDRTYC